MFDLAVVANGLDGTLQFYRVPETGDPVLLSAVRFAGAETTDVQVDATERLAYVALGSRGLAIVDLDGPASVQPIDDDRNGIDDRVLGALESPLSVTRLTADHRRGLVYGAQPARGLALLQMLPPRTRFIAVSRDPGRDVPGDEQPLSEGGVAFTSDEAISVELDSSIADGSPLSLVIEETPTSGARSLSFTDGSSVTTLSDGLNRLLLSQLPRYQAVGSASMPSRPTARAWHDSLHDRATTNRPCGLGLRNAGSVGPDRCRSRGGFSVSGVLEDGRILNLTRSTSTRFGSSNEAVVTAQADGTVQSVAGGQAEVTVTHQLLSSSVGYTRHTAPGTRLIERDASADHAGE